MRRFVMRPINFTLPTPPLTLPHSRPFQLFSIQWIKISFITCWSVFIKTHRMKIDRLIRQWFGTRTVSELLDWNHSHWYLKIIWQRSILSPVGLSVAELGKNSRIVSVVAPLDYTVSSYSNFALEIEARFELLPYRWII